MQTIFFYVRRCFFRRNPPFTYLFLNPAPNPFFSHYQMCFQNWQITYCKENNNKTKTIPLDKFLGVVMWAAASLLHPENQIRGEHEAVVAGQYSVKSMMPETGQTTVMLLRWPRTCEWSPATANRAASSRSLKKIGQILRGPLFHLGISSAFLWIRTL